MGLLFLYKKQEIEKYIQVNKKNRLLIVGRDHPATCRSG